MPRTNPSPVHEAPPRPAPPGSRVRFWAARLVLLTACASVVATSQATSPDVDSEKFEGAPLRLTTDAPRVTRPLVVRASAPKPVSKWVAGDMAVQATARWIPADPAQAVSPWLKLIITDEAGGAASTTSVILTAGTPVALEGRGALSPDCEMGASCEWTPNVNFEVQANAVPGTVELEWTAQAHVHVVDTSSVPDGFSVSVSAP
ncbi:MAG: hypothetical protein EOO71_23400 [Myxococcaceae bacterium]|nr:MAG: hypothetical protein EOO71_23400 [Myxococcaceae bacterium]